MQDDKDLVPEFVNSDGLTCFIKVGAEADHNYQNYILRGGRSKKRNEQTKKSESDIVLEFLSEHENSGSQNPKHTSISNCSTLELGCNKNYKWLLKTVAVSKCFELDIFVQCVGVAKGGCG